MTNNTKDELGLELLEINRLIGHQADFIDAVSALLHNKETREAGQLIFDRGINNFFDLLQDVSERINAVADQLLED